AGGGVATAYITTFIGHFIFETIPDIPTIGIVFATTVLTYGLDVWKKQQSLAYVGLIFGLITPIIVAPENPSIPAFVGYICLVVLGPVAIYYSLRWTYLLFLAAAFAWVYMFGLAGSEVASSLAPIYTNQLAIQGGILFCFIGFGIVPLIREWIDRKEIDQADILEYEAALAEAEAETIQVEQGDQQVRRPAKTLANPFTPHWTIFPYITASPILAAVISLLLWPDMPPMLWATLMVIASAVYFAAGYRMGQDKRYEVFQLPLFIPGAILLLFASFKATNNLASILLTLFSIEAVGFALFSQRQNKRLVMLLPHLLFIGAFFTWFGGIFPESVENPFLNLNFFASILFVASLIATAWAQEMGPMKIIYQFFAHLIALPVTGMEISALSDGQSYWLLLHILIHIGVFAAGLFTQNKALRYQGMLFAGAAILVQTVLDGAGSLTWPNLMLLITAIQLVGASACGKVWDDQPVTWGSYALVPIGVIALIMRFIVGEIATPFVGITSLATLSVIVVLLLITFLYSEKPIQILISITAHVMAAVWLLVQSQDSFYSQGLLLVTLLHIGFIAAGLMTKHTFMRYQGLVFAGITMLVQVSLDSVDLLDWPHLMLFLASAQVVGVCASGKYWDDKTISYGGYVLGGLGMLALLFRLISAEISIPFVGIPSLATLSMLIALLAVALWYSEKPADMVIGVTTHIFALWWLAVQSQNFANEQGVITALWAVYAVALLIAGLVFDKKLMRNLGIGTILLTVAKLLLFDLENVSTGGRVLLFSGFGVVLLVISYFTRTLWRREEEEDESGVELSETIDASNAAEEPPM
ncbi:MAG: DUF2339 domain-containing protein, partial [Chloroflexota bacterium]